MIDLPLTDADYQQIERDLALENLMLKRERIVLVRTIGALRAEVARLQAERNAPPAAATAAPKETGAP